MVNFFTLEACFLSHLKKMNFCSIPPEYEEMKNQIQNEYIKKIYLDFKFLYFNPNSSTAKNIFHENQNNFQAFLINYLSRFRLIVYCISRSNDKSFQNDKNNILNLEKDSQIVICIEKECIIIEDMKISFYIQVFNLLNKSGIATLNISKNIIYTNETTEETKAKEEVKSFYKYFQKEIKKNLFVSRTILSIAGFLIRRYYYPTEYFKDPSFFHLFDDYKQKEFVIKSQIEDFLFSKKKEETDLSQLNFLFDLGNFDLSFNMINLMNKIYKSINHLRTKFPLLADIQEISKPEYCGSKNIYKILNKIIYQTFSINNSNNKNCLHDFYEKDFIILRTLASTKSSAIYLALHLKTFYILMLKKINYPKHLSKEIQHEIYFCENYSHRCLVKFYGFLKNGNSIIGFIYEFMSNDTLKSFYSTHKDKLNDIYSIMTINRIIQGIDFLHKNNLIHRDLKPLNILIDHDYLPYISDFETIRHPIDKNEDPENDEMTNDIGSLIYSSPEQYYGREISFPTDIYSFGLIIYFIYEKKNMFCFDPYQNNIGVSSYHLSTKSKYINRLFKECIKEEAIKRPTINIIINDFVKEINYLGYYEDFLFESDSKYHQAIFVQFLYENFILQKNVSYLLQTNMKLILCFYRLNIMKNKGNISELYFELGNLYAEGNLTSVDLQKAKFFFEISAELNNSYALMKLSSLYSNGIGVEKNCTKSIEYLKLSAQQYNSDALFQLGNMYEYGIYVEQNYSKAIRYYELAAQQDDSEAFLHLGNLYEKGIGVKQNYTKAIKYYEVAAEQDDSTALYNLGVIYENGYGVIQDYKIAKKYYKLSSNEGNEWASIKLGYMYFEGKKIKQKYSKAAEYFKLAAEQDNSDANYYLGILYEKGYGVKQNYSKAIIHFELSAQCNNPKALLKLGKFYFGGYKVNQNYNLAIKYLEKSSQQDNSEALFILGIIYNKGYGVKKDYSKAFKYYEKSAKQNHSNALLGLGFLYAKGHYVNKNYTIALKYFNLSAKEKNSNALLTLGNYYCYYSNQDYYKAKYYYELSSKLDNSIALNKLGDLYFYGLGVERDYHKAKDYYNISAKTKNSDALLSLANIYYYGFGVKKDFYKAKKKFEASARQFNSDALLILGNFSFVGHGVEQNYQKAIEYYKLSALQNNEKALFFLGYLYSNDTFLEENVHKSIPYLKKCSEIHYNKIKNYHLKENFISTIIRYNIYCFRSYNDLGLIYIIDLNNIEKGCKYLKESAFGEYCLGQNNFGLYCKLYSNNRENAEYFFSKASKNNFSLAEYNLGYMKEEENKVDESINYFIKASEHEDEPLMFHNNIFFDKKYEISKMFIMCLTNFKLTLFYLSQSNDEKAKFYFVKSLSKLIRYSRFRFHFIFKENQNIFSYLHLFILNYPFFNLQNQQGITNNDIKIEQYTCIFKADIINKIVNFNSIHSEENIFIDKRCNAENEFVFDNPELLYNFINENKELHYLFIDEISDIITKMNRILYTQPYSILFGRIMIQKPKLKFNSVLKDINDDFYQGFDI